MEKFEIRLGFASPNFKFFHNPYSPSAEYEAIFSITRHQPGGICTNSRYRGTYTPVFDTGAYFAVPRWIQGHILEEIADLEYEFHKKSKRCIHLAIERAGTYIC